MYVFEKVTAKVVETTTPWQPYRLEFDFFAGRRNVPFKEAKNVADASFLEDRLAQMREAYAENKVGEEIELTSKESKIRGYQGGLCHIVMLGSKPHLVLLKRGVDAPTSPLVLDIAAGRMEEDLDKSWEETIFREGFTEIGYYTPHKRVLPVFRAGEVDTTVGSRLTGHVTTAYDQIGIGSREYEQEYFVRLFDQNDTYASIRVHMKRGYAPEHLSAGWAALPHLSSIELFQHIVLRLPKETTFSDLEYNESARNPVHRDVYVMNMKTGMTQVWNAGNMTEEIDIKTLLDRNRGLLEDMVRHGRLKDGKVQAVSPKVLAAIEQLPSRFIRDHDCSGLDSITGMK